MKRVRDREREEERMRVGEGYREEECGKTREEE